MDDLLTTRQLEQLLQVDRVTIYRMLGDGRLQGLKVGGQWRFPRAEVDAWLHGKSMPDLERAAASPVPAADDPLPLSCVEAIQGVFAQARDVAAVTTTLDGTALTEVSNGTAFCQMILSGDEGRARCAQSWRRAGGTPALCHAGLLCAAAPVVVEGRPVARAIACQFAPDGEWQADVDGLAAGLGLDAAQLARAVSEVHSLPSEDLPKMAGLVRSVAATYAEIGQERLKLLDRLKRIAEITALND